MKFYKVVARATLLYSSETWVTATRDMTRLEAAEMRSLRSVKRYTRLDKIRSEVIRRELEISGIQDVSSKHRQNWINHLARMDNTRPPKHALNYKPRGRRDLDALGKDGSASFTEQVKRPNPRKKKKNKKKKKKKMMMMMMMAKYLDLIVAIIQREYSDLNSSVMPF